VEAMAADTGRPLAALRADGGAAANNSLMQFQADLLDVPVERPMVTETTALGAAYLAGLAVGLWRDTAELEANWALDRRFEPAMARAQRAALRRTWARAVERVRGWASE
ncbi:MAG: glycerol kinase, partial [Thermoleophilia bacterium]|nr:glycerol kinase [Thermoleophilia bacterium]